MPGQVVSAVFVAHGPHRRHPPRTRIPITVAKDRQHPKIHTFSPLHYLLHRRFPLLHPPRRHRMRHPMMMLQNQIEWTALLEIQPIGHAQQTERIEIARREKSPPPLPIGPQRLLEDHPRPLPPLPQRFLISRMLALPRIDPLRDPVHFARVSSFKMVQKLVVAQHSELYDTIGACLRPQ